MRGVPREIVLRDSQVVLRALSRARGTVAVAMAGSSLVSDVSPLGDCWEIKVQTKPQR